MIMKEEKEYPTGERITIEIKWDKEITRQIGISEKN
jgi:hypothetical protein